MNDKKSDRLGTMVFTIAGELVNHFGKKLDRAVIDDITTNLTLEMCSGPTAWAFSGKNEPGQPIYDESKERELFEEFSRRIIAHDAANFPIRWCDCVPDEAIEDHLNTWFACAQSRAKAGEVGHE